jgi:hypothetical protein
MKRRLFPLLFLASGCYGYYPVTAAAPVGREVQLMLTDSGSVVLTRSVGAGVDAVSGRVTGDSSGTIILAMTGTRKRDGIETDWKGERVAVPRALVANVSERRFSRARTLAFSGALAVALVSMRQAFGGSGASSPGSGLPGGTGAK